MALKAGYKGIKKYIADKLNALGDLGDLATDKEIAEATDKVRADIAPVLEEAKAPTGGIAAGDQFYLNDILYTASADIAADANIVVTGDGKNADVSLNITAQLVEKADITALGTQEGATASKLYHPGEHFYKDGKFCTVIGSSDVTTDSTWTLNTNYVERDIAECLDLKTISLTPREGFTFATNSYAYKCGNVCVLNLEVTGVSLLADTATIIGDIGDSFPIHITRNILTTAADKNVRLAVEVNGRIYVRSVEALTNASLNGSITWVTK